MNTRQHTKSSQDFEKLIEHLKREIHTLTAFLDLLIFEQSCILNGDHDKLKELVHEKTDLSNAVQSLQGDRKALLMHILSDNGCTNEAQITLNKAAELDEAKNWDIPFYREHLIAILEKISVQTERNNYLLSQFVEKSKSLITKVQDTGKGQTYGMQGNVPKKKQVKTATLINRKG